MTTLEFSPPKESVEITLVKDIEDKVGYITKTHSTDMVSVLFTGESLSYPVPVNQLTTLGKLLVGIPTFPGEGLGSPR